MTQKIFDTDNEKDMADLWNILPESITKLTPIDKFLYTPDNGIFTSGIIKIDFHDKREINRPIQEATEADVGKLCKFWSDDGDVTYGVLADFIADDLMDIKYGNVQGRRWPHARRATKEEIEELI